MSQPPNGPSFAPSARCSASSGECFSSSMLVHRGRWYAPGHVARAGRVENGGRLALRMGDPYDVVVIGAGTGGYSTALRAAQLGKRVAIVERDERLGGTCLLRGCIPTKALLQSAEVLDTVDRAAEWGIKAAGEPDWSADRGVRGLDGRQAREGPDRAGQGSRDRRASTGAARLSPGPAVEVDGAPSRRRDVVLATGSAPKLLPGVEVTARVITSDQALWLTAIPASAVVIGAGAVGLEFASMYRSFGAEVTLIEALPRLAPLEDEDLSEGASRGRSASAGITTAAGASVDAIVDERDRSTVTLRGRRRAQRP